MVEPNLTGWMMMLLSGLSAGVGNLMLKRANLGPFETAVSPWFMGAISLFLLNVFLLAKSMENLPASLATPVVAGANFLVVVLGAALVFGESLNPWQYAGLLAIVLGIFLVGKA